MIVQKYPKTQYLDKLAQVGKLEINTPPNTNQDRWQKKAKRKAISDTINYKLRALKSPLCSSYDRALKCSRKVEQVGNKAITKRCKTRFCANCVAIRKMELINGYQHEFNKMVNPWFITLTIKAVKGHALDQTIKDMCDAFRQIKDVLRKTHKIKLKCMRNIESEYNTNADTFNPHFHLIVECDIKTARLIKSEWLKRFKQNNPKAQNIKPAYSADELFKYTTKGIKNRFDETALDTIYQALMNKRTFERYGIKKAKTDPTDVHPDLDFKEHANQIWHWDRSNYDWINDDGETLSGHVPSIKTMHILEKITGKAHIPNFQHNDIKRPEWIIETDKSINDL